MSIARTPVLAMTLPLLVISQTGCGARSTLWDGGPAASSAAPGACLGGAFSLALAGTSGPEATSIAADADCNVLVAGSFLEQMSVGAETLLASEGSDVYLAKLSPTGASAWARRLGGAGDQYVRDMAVDAEGAAVLAGESSGDIDLGGGPLGRGSFLAKLDPAGEHVWSFSLGLPTDTVTVTAVVVDPTGAVIVRGTYRGPVDLGGGPLPSTGQTGIFVARYDAGGTYEWSRAYAGTFFEGQAGGLAASPDGDVVVAGSFLGAVDLGEGPVTSEGDEDVFLVKLGSNGALRWARTFTGKGLAHAGPITIGAGGHVVAAGDFTREIDVDGAVVNSSDGPDQNIYVVELNADGSHLWSDGFGFADAESAVALSVAESGAVTVAGNFAGAIAFGQDGLNTRGGWDVFVAELDRSGAPVESHRFGDAYSQLCTDMAMDRAGYVVMTGTFEGAVDFGSGPLESLDGDPDVFVTRGKL